MNAEEHEALRRVGERRRALLADALAPGDRRLAVVTAIAARAGITLAEVEREAKRSARGFAW